MAVVLASLLLSSLLTFTPSLGASTTYSPLDATRPLLIPAGDGSFGSLESTFYAASVLSSAKDKSLEQVISSAWVDSYTLKTKSLEEASALAQLSALVSKKAPSSLKEVEAALVAGAKGASSVKDAYLALEGLAALKTQGWLKSAEVKGAAKAAADLLESLAHSDGSWKASTDKPETSPLSTGCALKGISALLALDAIAKDKALGLLRNVRSLFQQTVTGDAKEVYFDGLPEDGGPLPATALIASAYVSLATSLGSTLEVTKETVAGLGLYLATAGAPLTLFEAHVLFEALAALSANSVAVPLMVSVPGHFSVSDGAPPPAVTVYTVLGKPVPDAKVTLSSARLIAKGTTSSKNVASGKELTPKGSSYTLPSDVFSPSSSLGTYNLKIEVAPSGPVQVAVSPVTRSVTVTAKVSLSPVTISILDSDKGAPESEAQVELEEGSRLASLSATHLQKVKVSVALTSPSGKAFIPQQAFLVLVHESGVEHIFLLKGPASDTSGLISARLDILESLEKLYYLSGLYKLSLTLGDALMENSGSWPLGTVDLDLPEAPDSAPKPPSPPTSLDLRFAPKAEIAHIFRKPEKRPPSAVSLLFTGLTLVPLLGLLAGLGALGVNLRLLPTSGTPFLAAMGFHGGIAAILLLYLAFWIQVKLFTTLKVLLILGLVTAVPGHYILSFLADSSAKVKTT